METNSLLTESVTSPGRIRLRTEEASLESCDGDRAGAGAAQAGPGPDHGPLCATRAAAIVTTCGERDGEEARRTRSIQ